MFRKQEGVVLVFGVILLVALTITVSAYLCLVGSMTKHIGYQVGESQAFYIAEAGIEHALWLLKHGVEPDNLADEIVPLGNYTVVQVTGSLLTFTVTASSNTSGHEAEKGFDGDYATYWESAKVPDTGKKKEQWIQIEFSDTLDLDRVGFRAILEQRPIDYKWEVAGEDGKWRWVVKQNGNTQADVLDTFDLVEGKKYLRLTVTEAGDGANETKVAVREIVLDLWSKIQIEIQGTFQYPGDDLTATVVQDFLLNARTDPVTIRVVPGTWQEQ